MQNIIGMIQFLFRSFYCYETERRLHKLKYTKSNIKNKVPADTWGHVAWSYRSNI